MTIELALDGIIGEAPNNTAYIREALRAGGDVRLSINSPGGIATEGVAIHNLLRAHAGRVEVIVDSLAASAASLIAMAGDSIEMRQGSFLMIHDPSAIAIGPAATMQHTADVLEKMSNEYAAIYAKRSGQPVKRVREMMRAETWLSPSESVEVGMAEAASSEAARAGAVAKFDLTVFRNTPTALLAQTSKDAPMTTTITKPADAPVDTTAAILASAAAAKLSAVETQEVIAMAGGNVDKARDLIINKVADRASDQTHRPAHVGDGAGGDVDGHTAALGAAIDAKLQGKTASGPFTGMSMPGLAAEWLRARSIRPVSNDATSIVRQVLTTRLPTMNAPGFHTTSDFSVILGDSMQKSLTKLFAAADVGVSQIAGIGTMPDFREKSIGKLSSYPALLPMAEGAEFTYGTLEEAGERISVGTFGRAISVSLPTLVNDNVGGIQRSLRDTAFAAANLKASLILAAMLTTEMADGEVLFHASHNNTSNYGALGITSLNAIRAAMRLQKALDGTTVLGLSPAIVLVPAALETLAQQLAAGITPAQTTDVNPFSGIRVAVDPRLDAISSTHHYVFADPNSMPAIEFDTLEGTPSPKLEVSEQFDRLGTAYRVWWACGAAPIEHRAAVRSTGA